VEEGNGDWATATLLGGLTFVDRAALLAAGTKIERPDGYRLIEQGTDNDHAYLLLAGMVKVSIRDGNGHSALLGIRMAGDIVGEMGALERTRRSADVTTCGAVTATVIRSVELRALTQRHPDIGLGIAMMIGRRLRWANRRRLDFAARDTRARIAHVLFEVVRAYGTKRPTHWEIGVPLTQLEIASFAGTKLRTVEKQLSAMEHEGILIRKYRRIHVGDLDRLARIAMD
jgi:CRP/FNR family transcriptional regulator, cyclic AMP receptor protein